MCLLFIAKNYHPGYKLIVAANRDEFYKRRTAAAGYWKDHPGVLGGRDLEGMGTWMGVTLQGKVCMVTNYRDLKNLKANAPTRGKLVLDYLINATDSEAYLRSIESKAQEYNGFNLLAGNADELFYFSNYRQGVEKLGDGLYGLSNHLLETPWPKVVEGKKKIRPLLLSQSVDPTALFDALYDTQQASVDQLPDTGLSNERELALSSMFINTDNYGTRCSTVLLINRKNEVLFAERQYEPGSFHHPTQTFRFTI